MYMFCFLILHIVHVSFWWRRKTSHKVSFSSIRLPRSWFNYWYLSCGFFLCVGSVIPLLKDSIGILMQRIPVGLEKNVHIAYQRVSWFVYMNLFSFVFQGRLHKEWQIVNLTPWSDDSGIFVTSARLGAILKCESVVELCPMATPLIRPPHFYNHLIVVQQIYSQSFSYLKNRCL